MVTWNPSDYQKNSSQQQKWAREVIAKLRLRGDERVLDIGCGDGKVTAELARQLPNGSIVGLDASSQMVEFAAKTFPHIQFVVGDASRLPFTGEFDLIYSNATLHWIYNHVPVLAGIHRSLKPGARIVAQMGGKGCAQGVLDVLAPILRSDRWRTYFQNFGFKFGFHGPVEYRQWMLDAGLEPIRLDLFPKDMTHDGRSGFEGWVRTTWMPFIHAVPESSREAFLKELVDAYVAAHPPDVRGLVHVDMVRLEFEAVRPNPANFH